MEENSGDVKYDKGDNPDYGKKESHNEKGAKTHECASAQTQKSYRRSAATIILGEI